MSLRTTRSKVKVLMISETLLFKQSLKHQQQPSVESSRAYSWQTDFSKSKRKLKACSKRSNSLSRSLKAVMPRSSSISALLNVLTSLTTTS